MVGKHVQNSANHLNVSLSKAQNNWLSFHFVTTPQPTKNNKKKKKKEKGKKRGKETRKKPKNRSAMRTWGLMLNFICFGLMLFSNISIWELTCCYKWKGREVITISKGRAENIWQYLRCSKYDWNWSSMFDTIQTSTPIFSTETETKEKGEFKWQHLYQLISDMQTLSHLWFTLFKCDELLMSLRKLFENLSTSEFLRDMYIGHCLISRVKIMNNVLNRITLHWMYILTNLDY